nr:MAG: hypothetical protein 1 [Leviviridae sp.]
MAQRDRETHTVSDTGWRRRFNETVAYGNRIDYQASVMDFVDPQDCKPFNRTMREHKGGRINKSGTGNLSAIFSNYLADRYRTDIDSGQLSSNITFTDDLGDVVYATRAAARTNPSRPYVDVPVNVLQLGEITSLIRKRGDSIIKEAAKENLRYQFAIKPLVGDLIKLCDFQDQVENRIKELERLRGVRGLRRTIPLGGLAELSKTASGSEDVQTAGGLSIFANPYTQLSTCQIGAHVRWKPAVNLSGYSPGDMRRIARRAVLGLTADLSTLWEVVPWSWLIDWSSSIGSYLAANRNIIPADLVGVYITRLTRSTRTWNARSGSGWTLTSFVTSVETKKRSDAVTIAPVAHFPFLSGNQMGILASLYVTRA